MWAYIIKFENGQYWQVKTKFPDFENIKIKHCGFDLFNRHRLTDFRCRQLITGPNGDNSLNYLNCEDSVLKHFGAEVISKERVDGRRSEVKRLEWASVDQIIKNASARYK